MQLGYTYLKNLRKSLPLVDYGQKSFTSLGSWKWKLPSFAASWLYKLVFF